MACCWHYHHKDNRVHPQKLAATIALYCMQAYKDSGDTAAKPGDRIWIAEMYGYSFGAARANVWHKFQHDFMLYPGYTPSSE
jgi:hypothetical protein